MATLHLGVLDQPYPGGAITTGRLARILEDKYGIMAAFVKRHKADIQASVREDLVGTLEALRMGRNAVTPYAQACSEIENQFKQFLTLSEIETMGIAGVPTQAALMGVSQRFKGKRNKGKGRKGANVRRPSFIDSGTYRASARAWVD